MKHLSESDFQDYLDANISERKTEITSHLEACKICRNKLKHYEMLYKGLKADQIPSLSADFSKSVIEKIQIESVAEERQPIWVLILSIAGAALGLGVAGYFLNFARILGSIRIEGIKEYISEQLYASIGRPIEALNIDMTFVIITGLILIIVGAIDYMIRRGKHRPISFLV